MAACPGLDTLRRLDSERVGATTDAALEAHLEHCESCRRVLEARLLEDSWRDYLPPTNLDSLVGFGPPPAPEGFTLVRPLGRGGMGVVYLATRLDDGQPVALKYLGGGLDDRARWHREAEAMRRVDHPGVVRLLDSGEVGCWVYLVLEYVPGGRLEDRLNTPPGPRSAALLVETLARAMHEVHDVGLLHLDLKPSNVLLADGPERPLDQAGPKVADFGLVLPWGDDEATWTMANGPRGTPSYMAPEQLAPKRSTLGPAADIYALGAILYRMLTGRPPFLAPSRLETYFQLRNRDPISPRRLNPDVPKRLETICLACLRKESSRRYASALDLADDLRRFLDGLPIRQRPTPAPVLAYRWCRRHRATAALSAVLAASLVVLFLVQGARLRAAQAERERLEREQVELATDAQVFWGLLSNHHRITYAAIFDRAKVESARVLDDLAPLRARLRQKRRDGTINLAYLSILGQLEALTGRFLIDEGRSREEAEEALAEAVEAVEALEDALRREPNLDMNRNLLVNTLGIASYHATDRLDYDRAFACFARARAALGDPGQTVFLNAVESLSLYQLHTAGRLRSQGEDALARHCLLANRELIDRDTIRGIETPWLPVHRALTTYGLEGGPEARANAGELIGGLDDPATSQGIAMLRIAWTGFAFTDFLDNVNDPLGREWIDALQAAAEAGPVASGLDHNAISLLFNHVFYSMVAPRWADMGDLITAGQSAEWFLPLLLEFAGQRPDPASYAAAISLAFFRAGTGRRAAGDLDAAEQSADRLLSLARDCVDQDPQEAAFASMLYQAYNQKAKNAWQVDDLDRVKPWLRLAVDELRRAVALDPGNADYRTELQKRERKLAGLTR